MAATGGWIPAGTMYNRCQKHPLGSTIKEKEYGAVLGEIFRFLSIIRGFFSCGGQAVRNTLFTRIFRREKKLDLGVFLIPHM